jgi:DNA-binding NarL/FixJ family response regulator
MFRFLKKIFGRKNAETSPGKIRVMITDDHRIFRDGVKRTLAKRTGIEWVGEAIHGQDLLEKLDYLKPDIILLGITMPVMDGLSTLPTLKKKYPAIKVIMLTMHNDPSIICRTIELGANAYLTKESSDNEIYEAILACHQNWFYVNKTVSRALAERQFEKPPVSPISFTEKEWQILKLLARQKSIEEIDCFFEHNKYPSGFKGDHCQEHRYRGKGKNSEFWSC